MPAMRRRGHADGAQPAWGRDGQRGVDECLPQLGHRGADHDGLQVEPQERDRREDHQCRQREPALTPREGHVVRRAGVVRPVRRPAESGVMADPVVGESGRVPHDEGDDQRQGRVPVPETVHAVRGHPLQRRPDECVHRAQRRTRDHCAGRHRRGGAQPSDACATADHPEPEGFAEDRGDHTGGAHVDHDLRDREARQVDAVHAAASRTARPTQ